MPAASASKACAATAPMAPDALEERSDLWLGGSDGDEPVEELVGEMRCQRKWW
jgi:hypothetical protein